jgi:peptidyl-prolyl cis-trans isomerase B (cyclophilin B)
VGWFVQQPQKRTADTPDVVAVGNKIGGFTPAISISVKNANGTSVEDYSSKIKKTLQKPIEEGRLEILNEEKTTINGNEAFVTEAVGKFNLSDGEINVKFKEVIMKSYDKFYIITYTNSENNFDAVLPKFEEALDSFKATPTENSEKNNGGCLIATAAYGTELASQVQFLREIRNNVVFETNAGATFMTGFNQFYYSFSPTISDWERQSPAFKEAIKVAITPLLTTLSILNYLDIDSEQEMLGYGAGIILLNIGMYFVAPTIIIIKTKNRFQKFTAKT